MIGMVPPARTSVCLGIQEQLYRTARDSVILIWLFHLRGNPTAMKGCLDEMAE